MKLSGKVAIITGAGSGIGRAAALSLAIRGVALVIVGRSREKLARTAEFVRAHPGGFAEIVVGDEPMKECERPLSKRRVHGSVGSTSSSTMLATFALAASIRSTFPRSAP